MFLKLSCIIFFLGVTLFSNSRRTEPNHEIWNSLLNDYVDDQAQVDYKRLKEEALDRLDAYATHLATAHPPDPNSAHGKAFLINAYNALVVQWVVLHYPTESIMSTPNPFRKARHTVAGKIVSLDEIESQLRTTEDPRIHSALVCAALSCPPLRNEAYVAEQVDQQLDDNTRQWLANPKLNEFDTTLGQAKISPIFDWYSDDFASYPGGLEGFLRHYAPPKLIAAVKKQKLDISTKHYHWGLNDQSNIGAQYSTLRLVFDWLKSWFH